jgi:hypothetical protein
LPFFLLPEVNIPFFLSPPLYIRKDSDWPLPYTVQTYGVVLLRRRAVRLRKETGDPGFVTDQERFRRPFSEVMRISIVRPLQILVTEPVRLLLLASSKV